MYRIIRGRFIFATSNTRAAAAIIMHYFFYIVVNFTACIISLMSMSITMKTVRRMQCSLHSVSSSSIYTGKGVDFSTTIESSPPTISMNRSEKLLSWGVNLTEEAMIKTGAEMRKARKSLKSPTKTVAKKKKVKNSKSSAETVQTRFHLGNGMDAISVQNLLDLVKSTAPYVFPEFAIRQIIEEDDDGEDDDDDDDDDDLDSDLKLLSKHRNIPVPIENVLNPSGWKNILLATKPSEPSAAPTASERIHYFSLCLASHFATVATFVPTDVDSKIRGHCW